MTDTTSDAGPVTFDLRGAVARITIDDGKANALSHEVLGAIETALDTAERSAGAVVIVGREGKFTAGFDLSVMTAGPEQARELLGRGAELALRLTMFPVPVVMGVTGHALAMGGILLSAGDVRIGAEGPYKIGLPEVRIGMPVPGFAVELCRSRLSPRAFNKAILLAHSFTPAEALDGGFFDELLPLEQVPGRADEVAAELAEQLHRGPFRMTREITNGALVARLRSSLADDLASFDVADR
ncbi:MAG: crotonase/enoyl-CoA hydratase family protein [Actinomycetes bacterium]